MWINCYLTAQPITTGILLYELFMQAIHMEKYKPLFQMNTQNAKNVPKKIISAVRELGYMDLSR